MGKLILQMNLSVDAYAADRDSKLDWMLTEEDDRHIQHLNEINNNVGHIIIGRKMAEESVPYWEGIANSGSSSKESVYARFFVNTPKTVFSKSLRELTGKNIHIEKSDLREAVTTLKRTVQKDIIVYGGANFVSSLIDERLTDELNLFFHPVSVGCGLKIFNSNIALTLIQSQPYSNGIVFSQFRFRD